MSVDHRRAKHVRISELGGKNARCVCKSGASSTTTTIATRATTTATTTATSPTLPIPQSP
jgi:hypothetical protein